MGYWQKASELEPKNGEYWFAMGTIYAKNGDTKQQMKLFKKAAKLGSLSAKNWLKNNSTSK
jgi:Flp pilus assembly protein TadD